MNEAGALFRNGLETALVDEINCRLENCKDEVAMFPRVLYFFYALTVIFKQV